MQPHVQQFLACPLKPDHFSHLVSQDHLVVKNSSLTVKKTWVSNLKWWFGGLMDGLRNRVVTRMVWTGVMMEIVGDDVMDLLMEDMPNYWADMEEMTNYWADYLPPAEYDMDDEYVMDGVDMDKIFNMMGNETLNILKMKVRTDQLVGAEVEAIVVEEECALLGVEVVEEAELEAEYAELGVEVVEGAELGAEVDQILTVQGITRNDQ